MLKSIFQWFQFMELNRNLNMCLSMIKRLKKLGLLIKKSSLKKSKLLIIKNKPTNILKLLSKPMISKKLPFKDLKSMLSSQPLIAPINNQSQLKSKKSKSLNKNIPLNIKLSQKLEESQKKLLSSNKMASLLFLVWKKQNLQLNQQPNLDKLAKLDSLDKFKKEDNLVLLFLASL